ncbi:MAG: aquaporin Z [Alphaproteobacteria bacterium]|nr:aquaporin Z [Alphaproteobacteria bacterium]
MRKLFAEFIGTFVLVLFGCGAAILAGQYIGYTGISFAFGLAVMVMIYAVGPISGGHFNPAVSVGLCCAGKFEWKHLIPYIIFQCLGAIAAAGILYLIATGVAGGGIDVGGFAANTYSTYTLCAALLTEIVFTAVFVLIIIGVISKESVTSFAGAAIGLALAVIHLVTIPVTNTSVNPARSLSQALFATDPAAISQLWVFWVAPIAGAILAALIWKIFLEARVTAKKKK